MIFDSHAHYNDSRFNEDRFEILDNIRSKGVSYIMNVADSMLSLDKVLALSERYPFIFSAVGIHPEAAGELTDSDMEILRRHTENPKVLAIGEIGLDYYYDDVPRDVQKKWFARQIALAWEVNLPIIVHDRDAHADTLDILRAENARETGGILHCFSGSRETARDLLSLGMYIGIGGTLTFKNARRVREVAEYVPLESIVLETDCPYLAPEPFRGKRNSSDLIKYVAEALAEIKGISAQEVILKTAENAKRCFGIKE